MSYIRTVYKNLIDKRVHLFTIDKISLEFMSAFHPFFAIDLQIPGLTSEKVIKKTPRKEGS